MFLHMPTLKRLTKVAFNSKKLTIGKINDGTFMDCGLFIAWFDDNYIPNKVKALIMEFAGELPEEGHPFKASKEGNQYEIDQNDYWNVQKRIKDATERYVVTPVALESKYTSCRLLQQARDPYNIKAIDGIAITLIDPAEADYENGENTPQGPFSDTKGKIFWWKSDFCILGFCGTKLYTDIATDVQHALEGIELDEDKKEVE